MAIRKTRLITKNSISSGATLPTDILKGEAVVNLNNGILFYSGASGGNFTPASDNLTSGYFEVGSNLYDLRLRNQITQYQGFSGSSLSGKFLSGTTSGFTLANISSIGGISDYDYYPESNMFVITSTNGSSYSATVTSVSGLTVNGNLTVTGNTSLQSTTATTLSAGTINVVTSNVTGTQTVNTLNVTGNTTLSSFTGGTGVINGDLTVTGNTSLQATTATTLSSTTITVTNLSVTNNLSVTGNTSLQSFTAGTGTINGNLTVTGTTNLSGTTLYGLTITSPTNPSEVANVGFVTSYTNTNEIYVTGATYSPASVNNDDVSWTLLYKGLTSPGYTFSGENTFTTGGTYDNTAKLITFKRNDGTTGYTVDLSTIDVNDTYVTGGTINTLPTNSNISGTTKLLYNDTSLTAYTIPYTDVFVTGFSYSNNTFTIKDNSGNTYSDVINTVTGLTVNGNLTVTGTSSLGVIQSSNLSPNLVVYTTGVGQLTTKAGFGYNQSTDTLTAPNASIGSGGSVSGAGTGDLVVHGNLTVFGGSISAFTSELYIEDKNITLNFNPTGSTSSSSVNSGFAIQDGSGVSGSNVNFDVIRMAYFTGNTGQNPEISEYNSLTNGYAYRGWITQLNDIVIRSTDVTDDGTAGSVKGVRVLGEFDTLDGGVY